MNETSVSFNLLSNITIDELRTRTVSICTTGHKRTNFIVVLTCMADGTKLLLLIIFKLKKIPKGNFLSGVIIHANLIEWINENEILY